MGRTKVEMRRWWGLWSPTLSAKCAERMEHPASVGIRPGPPGRGLPRGSISQGLALGYFRFLPPGGAHGSVERRVWIDREESMDRSLAHRTCGKKQIRGKDGAT